MASELHPWRFELEFFQVSVATSHFAATPQSDVVRIIKCTWFSASWRRFRYDRKCPFSCIYSPQITISPTSLFSANFNGNRVKNHPKPWTCPLKWAAKRAILMFHKLWGTNSQDSVHAETTTFEEKGEPKLIRTEVPPLTSLTPYR